MSAFPEEGCELGHGPDPVQRPQSGIVGANTGGPCHGQEIEKSEKYSHF
jgi:hypothetical protein